MSNYQEEILDSIKEKKFIGQLCPPTLIDKLSKDNDKMLYYNGKSLRKAFIIDLLHSIIYDFIRKDTDTKIINSSFLKNKYGMYYNTYLMYLEDMGFISCISGYIVGKVSKKYKLNNTETPFIKYKNYDKLVMKKYRKNIIQKTLNSDEKNGIEEYIKDKLICDLCYIRIDYDKANKILDDTGLGSDNDTMNAYIKNQYSIYAIHNNDFFYKFDEFGRFHTNFTNLKSIIRDECVYIEGEETHKFDIKNSQPLFFLKILDKNLFRLDQREKNIFFETVLNGTIYEYIMESYPNYIDSRKKAKNFIYNVLFGQNKRTKDDVLFAKLFPTIHQYIKNYKDRKNNYRVLAHDLQRLESNFIFNVVIKEIMKNYEDIRLFTVHDSIHVRVSDRDKVSVIFNGLLEKEFNQLSSNLSPYSS